MVPRALCSEQIGNGQESDRVDVEYLAEAIEFFERRAGSRPLQHADVRTAANN